MWSIRGVGGVKYVAKRCVRVFVCCIVYLFICMPPETRPSRPFVLYGCCTYAEDVEFCIWHGASKRGYTRIQISCKRVTHRKTITKFRVYPHPQTQLQEHKSFTITHQHPKYKYNCAITDGNQDKTRIFPR